MVGCCVVFHLAKIFSKIAMAVIDSGSSGVAVSCGCVAQLGIQPDDQVEINIALLSGLEKHLREVLYDVTIEVGKLLVKLPAFVAEGLFVDFLLGANWLKAIGACLNITRLEIKVMDEKLKLKKMPDPSEDFVGSGHKIYASECVVVAPIGVAQVGVIHCLVEKQELCYVNSAAKVKKDAFTLNKVNKTEVKEDAPIKTEKKKLIIMSVKLELKLKIKLIRVL